MSAVIRLKKFGTKKRPFYRIVVMDSRAPRDGRTIEELGFYHPIAQEGKQISFDVEKAVKWLKFGVMPSHTVRRIFNRNNLKLGNPELALTGETGESS
ncbi:MAG: 30S ribosomal protein S16 [Spirochaetaceae bacterium]|jgi:small subunit ribosomal protein S16|nr:30S ribosomal protein S16 [Spirochaetaceae bacterium]